MGGWGKSVLVIGNLTLTAKNPRKSRYLDDKFFETI